MRYTKSKTPISRSYPNHLHFGNKPGELNENLFWSIHAKCMKLAEKNLEQKVMIQDLATPWIHLQDAVSRGTITPLEALDAIELGYLPEELKVRKSAYSHIL